MLLLASAAGCDALGAAGSNGAGRNASPGTAVRRSGPDSTALRVVFDRAAELPKLRSLLVHSRGELVAERYFGGATANTRANIKSASKSVVSALVGIAIANRHLKGVDQSLGSIFPRSTPGLDSARSAITIEDLLTMRSGLESTSFGNYGEWVTSRNWVRHALTRPFVAPPGHEGGPMIYSTGSSHLLSAVLSRTTGTNTFRFAARELARPLGIRLQPWTTDPQGVYFGGNEMRMTPREMLAFGKLYLNGGKADDGTQVIPREWIDSSWVPRATSPWSGHQYGYGWWIRESRGHTVYFAWGFGGQFIFVVPSLELVVVATSDPDGSSRDGGHLQAIHSLLDELVAPSED